MAFEDAPRRGEGAATDRIAREIAPALAGMGYELVRVHLSGGGRPILQIMAERSDRQPMTVEDCATISRDISALLDIADPIAGPYTLEVSSPGIDRPLLREADYVRFAGFEARVEADGPIDGRRRFQGRIVGIEEGAVVLRTPAETYRVPFARIHRAKLVLTDDLIAATAAPAAAAH
ncbi:MAG: ribosome maturation factor RimP [Alphaproteobacteria bacterium]|nr:ribosome maturation factor RimP [Alphaproteobacteria bacterium]